MEFQYNLNDTVKDSITGFTGIVVARTEWLHGCVVYQVKSKELKDGKPIDSIGFDEGQLELVTAAEKPKAKAATTGGPARNVARARP